MDQLKLTELLILIIFTTTNCFSLNPIPSNNKWFQRDITTEQGLHSLLANIDDKLRGMDSIRFSINRLEMTFARMSSKIDSIESQLTTVQSSMHIKMREMYEMLLKHDFQREQMIQKCEGSQSRVFHKINTLETHFEDSFNKFQGNSEVNLGKIENKQNEINNKVIEINNSIDLIKSHNVMMEDKMNITQKEIVEHFKNTQQQLAKKDHIDKIENKINGLHNRLNKSEVIWTQNDGPKALNIEQEHIINDIKSELRSEAQKIGNKVSNMYNDMWQKMSLLENLLKDSIIQTNATQKDFQDDLKQIFIDQRDNEGFLDIVVDRILAVIQTKFNDLHRRVENNFQTVISAQNEITGTCQRLHDDESEYWSRIALILEKILDTFLNKTTIISKQNTELLEALKGHNSQMIRTVSDAKNMVITLAEENSHDHKDLDNSIIEVLKKSDIISSTLQEMQDQFDDINGTVFNSNNCVTNISQTLIGKPPEIKNTTIQQNHNNTIHAIEANYSNGVIKIITEDTNSEIDPKELGNLNNITVINLKHNNGSNKDNIERLMYLNNALSTSKLTSIIGTLNDNKSKTIENIFNITSNPNSQKDTENNISNKKISDLNKQNISNEDIREMETSFILSYIHFIKGHITKEEFLQDGYPKKSFKNMQEMIAYLKQLKFIRNEFLRELDRYDREEIESDVVVRSHELFDTTNFEDSLEN